MYNNKYQTLVTDSPCAPATLAYADEIRKKPSTPNAAGMIAYITKAIQNGKRKLIQYALLLQMLTGMLTLRRKMKHLPMKLLLLHILRLWTRILILTKQVLVPRLLKLTQQSLTSKASCSLH